MKSLNQLIEEHKEIMLQLEEENIKRIIQEWLTLHLTDCEDCKENMNGEPNWGKHCCYPCQDMQFITKIFLKELKEQ